MSDAILEGLGKQRTAAAKSRHRHRWDVHPTPRDHEEGDSSLRCRCGAVQDVEATRKGRNNRSRGNAYEREVAKRLGASRTGQYGDKADVTGEWIVVQCKVGGAFPERIWSWLQQLPHGTERLRAVVIGDAPGSSGKRRSLICLDLDDFADWFGTTEEHR